MADDITGQINVRFGDSLVGNVLHSKTATGIVDKDGAWHDIELPVALIKQHGGLERVNGLSVIAHSKQKKVGSTRRPAEIEDISIDATAPTRRKLFGGNKAVDKPAGDATGAADASSSPPNTITGSVPWAVLLCRFGDMPNVTPQSPKYFDGLIGASYPGLNHYWTEVSNKAISLDGSRVYGWYNLPKKKAAYVDPTTGALNQDLVMQDCIDRADRPADLAQYHGISVMLNDTIDADGWGGLYQATIEGKKVTLGGTILSPAGYKNQWVYVQEMGHAFGLVHSSGSGAATYDSKWDPMSSGCKTQDATYGCVAPHTIGHHKNRLGWIEASRIATVNPGEKTTLTLEQIGLPSLVTGDTKTLLATIPINGSTTNFYTVEARRSANSGYDINIPGDATIIHKVDTSGTDRQAQVVDSTDNGDPNDDGAMWTPGETFTDSVNNITAAVSFDVGTGYNVSIANGSDLANLSTGSAANAATGTPLAATFTFSITATPNPITAGQNTVLHLNATNVSTCNLAPFSNFYIAPDASGAIVDYTLGVSPSTPGQTYYWYCTPKGGTNQVTSVYVKVDPPPAPTVTLTATPNSVSPNQTVSLTWTSTNALGCTASALPATGDWTGSKELTSSGFKVYPAVTTTYTLTCTNGYVNGSDSEPVTVSANLPPDGQITAPPGPVTISPGQSVVFNSNATDPENNTPFSFAWIFQGGTPSTSTLQNPGAVTYATAGTYSASLTVTDSKGAKDLSPATRTITVAANNPPNGTITPSALHSYVAVGKSVNFSGSATDPEGHAVTYSWTFTNGAPASSTLQNPGAVTFSTLGCYPVTLTVKDSIGLSDPTAASVTVCAITPPNGTITSPAANTTITAGQSVSFAATATDPNWYIPFSFYWNFGNGQTSTLQTPGAIVFSTPGTYVVNLTATNSVGVADPTPDQRTITVLASTNSPPDGVISPPSGSSITIPSGLPVYSFSGYGTDPNGDTVTYLWDFYGKFLSTAQTPGSASFPSIPGNYTVTLTVTDSKGLADPTPAKVTVIVASPPTLTLSATPSTILVPGTSTTVSWTSANVTSCTASSTPSGWSGSKSINGSFTETLLPTVDTTYTLTCVGADGSSVQASSLVRLEYVIIKVPGVDFVVVGAVTIPSVVTRGTNVTASATIRNQGSVDDNPYYTGLYLSTDSTITTADIVVTQYLHPNVLAAQASETVQWSGNLFWSALAPGTYYIGAIADRYNGRVESNETNNVGPATIITVK